jgi:hypothetical protein
MNKLISRTLTLPLGLIRIKGRVPAALHEKEISTR